MAFSGVTFLYFFLPLTLLCHNLAPMRWKNPILLIASLVFFAWASPLALVTLPIHILVHYFLGFMLEKLDTEAHRRTALTVGVILDILPVLFLPLLGDLIPVHLSAAAALLAIHGITYLTEVYRREVRAQLNFAVLGVYLIMFPRALAGPVLRYSDLRPALARRTFYYDRSAEGIWRFTVGLAKKVLLADRLYALWQQVQALSAPGAAAGWLGLSAFLMALWLGFSGCCDMAAGLGGMLGFDFPENFLRPLSARSLADHCRRWNATFHGWMRDHFWHPFFAQRPALFPLAVLLASVLTGYFYGGRPALLLWGLYTGLILLGERYIWGKALNKCPRFLRHAAVILSLMVGCIFFSAGSFSDIARGFRSISGANGFAFGQALYLTGSYWLVLLVSLLTSFRWPQTLLQRLNGRFRILRQLRPVMVLLILAAYTAYMV